MRTCSYDFAPLRYDQWLTRAPPCRFAVFACFCIHHVLHAFAHELSSHLISPSPFAVYPSVWFWRVSPCMSRNLLLGIAKDYHHRIVTKAGRKGWQGGADLASSAEWPVAFCVALLRAWIYASIQRIEHELS